MGDVGSPLLQASEASVSKDSLEAARALATSSGRRVDTPVRKSFVRPMIEAAGPKAPLAQIYSGGRGGTVAVKVFLALLWKCSAAPFCTDKPARAWATLLDLDDPTGLGARRVKDALRTLERAKLIEMKPQPGLPNLVTLRDESGLGIDYEAPSTAYSKAQRFRAKQPVLASNTYFKVPRGLWTTGYIQKLSGPALVMLLILLAEQAGTGGEVWFSTEEFPRRYNVSHKTRAAGTKELIKKGLLTVESRSLAAWSGASVFDTQRYRKVYRLTPLAQATPAEPLPSPARPPRPPVTDPDR
ncbi:hypothetical protein [Nocardia fluminea]|uniref:hypothetical protein n=1 Tax=Nocardia fluminea TaxID=134984 RepID=UPI003D0EF722